MARILPEHPPQTLPAEVSRAFKALKLLPDDYLVWHHLAPWQQDVPDFLVRDAGGRVLLIKVSPARIDANPSAQMLLLGEAPPPRGLREAEILESFVRALESPARQRICRVVLFPHIPHRRLEDVLPEPLRAVRFVGREWMQRGADWNSLFASEPLPEDAWRELRQRFTPEAVVPADLTVRSRSVPLSSSPTADFLLDYDQERALKMDLWLPEEVRPLARDLHLTIVNGVAGSGKTLILLFRLRLLLQHFPTKRFLVLTHNRPLVRDIENRFCRLMKRDTSPPNVEWSTFMQWCRQHWPEEEEPEVISIAARRALIREVWQEFYPDSLAYERLLTEIDWLKDQLPMTRSQYLEVDRRGRGFGLTRVQRERMWQAIVEYQHRLRAQGKVDWGDLPRRVWKAMQEGSKDFPQYDFILVDEAQFFAPLWFAIIKRIMAPRAHLFVAADPRQGFLRRGLAWKSLGLEARGRSFHLRRSYRSTQKIIEFADLFYRMRLGDDRDSDVLIPDIADVPVGVFPMLIPVQAAQDEIHVAVKEIAQWVKSGVPRQHILVLHARWEGAEAIRESLNRLLGKDVALDSRVTYPGNYIRVTTLDAGGGLEAPIVVLVGMHELIEIEQSMRLSDEEREELIRSHTRKLYMAFTRAGQRVVITWPGIRQVDIQKWLKQIAKR